MNYLVYDGSGRITRFGTYEAGHENQITVLDGERVLLSAATIPETIQTTHAVVDGVLTPKT